MKKGVNVIATCLKEESVTQLQEMEEDNMIAIQMDVSSRDSIQQAYDTLIDRHPQIQHGNFSWLLDSETATTRNSLI